MKKKSYINIGNSGEYFVAAELERRDFSVAVPMSNTPCFDLLALDRKDVERQICIQVKTTSGTKSIWKMGKKVETLSGKNIFYVLVKLNGLQQPDYYIIPSEIISKEVYANHQKWLNTPGKKGQKHNDNNIRQYRLADDSIYKNNWDLLRQD